MEIVENKALKLRVRNPSRITSVIPKSALVGDNEVLVKWGLEEAQVLRNLGVKNVPSPINKDYQWPGLYKPFEHQRVTASFLTMHRRAFCFSEQGTAKTGCVIWAADYLMSLGAVRRALVLCPLSIMQSAWQSDLFHCAMHRTVTIAHHRDARRRKELIREGSDFVILNYDGLEIVRDDVIKSGDFDLIVADEANYLKNVSTTRWKTLSKILRPDSWVWLLTGTPAAQSPEDAYGLARVVNPDGVPKFKGAFKDMVMNKITQFKWVPKPNATEIVHQVLQPAIRFTKEECLDLPEMTYVTREVPLSKQQEKYYQQMRTEMLMVAAGEEVSAVNAAAKLTKLLQISCIMRGTPVLTDRGWVEIQDVTARDLVWDGVEWVTQAGAIYKGDRSVVVLDGVSMTPEHLVLTQDGWQEAGVILHGDASNKLGRAAVRLPDCDRKVGVIYRQNQESPMEVPMRLRINCHTRKPISQSQVANASEKLWVPSRQRKTSPDRASVVWSVVQDAAQMLFKAGQGLQELWGARYRRLSSMARIIQRVFRGYGTQLQAGADIGTHKQQWPILAYELPMGDCSRAKSEQKNQSIYKDTQGENDGSASGQNLRYKNSDLVRTINPLRLAGKKSSGFVAPVYDLLNCGPRSRFVVRGVTGKHLIVHNCGAVYADSKEIVDFDCRGRMSVLREVIDESSHKVLVFASYRHSIYAVSEELKKSGYTVDVIDGGVSPGKRTEIFNRFQTTSDPRVLVIQPQAAAHGVTLHAANTVVWWSPVMSVETYMQANARVHRAGQKNKTTVVHLQGSSVERKVYKMLQGKVDVHEDLVGLYREEMRNE